MKPKCTVNFYRLEPLEGGDVNGNPIKCDQCDVEYNEEFLETEAFYVDGTITAWSGSICGKCILVMGGGDPKMALSEKDRDLLSMPPISKGD